MSAPRRVHPDRRGQRIQQALDIGLRVQRRERDAQSRLWRAIDATRGMRTSELWSWTYADGRFQPQPFGQGQGDVDESNAAQLWSTVYLAIPRPAR